MPDLDALFTAEFLEILKSTGVAYGALAQPPQYAGAGVGGGRSAQNAGIALDSRKEATFSLRSTLALFLEVSGDGGGHRVPRPSALFAVQVSGIWIACSYLGVIRHTTTGCSVRYS